MRVKYNADTQLVLWIGDPLDQGCAGYLHNAMYEFANVNAVNIPVVVPKGGLPEFLAAVKTLHIAGFDLTTPHKSDIIPYLDEVEPSSHAFQCVNHVKICDGRLIGVGLDGEGMGMALEARFGNALSGRRLLVIGAGAVAGPVAASLCERGVSQVSIINRTPEKAQYIADTLYEIYGAECRWATLNDENLRLFARECDLAIDCTSRDARGRYSYDFVQALPDGCAAADVLYPDTAFLQAARNRGLETLDGRGMMFYQQLAMMEFRFGVKPDPAMLAEAEEALEIAIAMRDLRNARKNG